MKTLEVEVHLHNFAPEHIAKSLKLHVKQAVCKTERSQSLHCANWQPKKAEEAAAFWEEEEVLDYSVCCC